MIEKSIIDKHLKGPCVHLLIAHSDTLSSGHVRLQTRFRYPDGSWIDLFLDAFQSTQHHAVITDFSSTASWLDDAGGDIAGLETSSSEASSLAEFYKVRFQNGAMSLTVPWPEFLSGIVSLAQACLALAASRRSIEYPTTLSVPAELDYRDLIVESRREVPKVPPKDLVRMQLIELNIGFSPKKRIWVDAERAVKVDFLIEQTPSPAALMILNFSARRATAERYAEHVFTVFYDLREWDGHKVAVIDDMSNPLKQPAYTDADLRRITRYGEIVNASALKSTLLPLLGQQ